MTAESSDLRIIRPKHLAELLGVSLMSLWRWERDGAMPKKIRLGPNTRGYLLTDINLWLSQRAASKDEPGN